MTFTIFRSRCLGAYSNWLCLWDYTPWMCLWMTGFSLTAFWAELIALLQRALFWFCHLVRITMTICAVRSRGNDVTYTQCTWTHKVSFPSSSVPGIWKSKCLFRPKMTGVQDRGSDAETRPPGFTHCCPSQPSQQLQHFSTSAPFWPTLNITFVYRYDVQADYIVMH